jgi:hypothetical protein
VLVVGLVLVAGAGGYRVLQERRSRPPIAAVTAEEGALVLLSRDDTPSRQQALEALRALVQRFPSFVDGRATYVLALALQMDDERALSHVLTERVSQLGQTLASHQASSGPEAQEQVARETRLMQVLKEKIGALEAQLIGTNNELSRAVEAIAPLHAIDEPDSLLRAEAYFATVMGTSQAKTLVERYRSRAPKDAWARLLPAETVLNTGGEKPDATRAAEELAELGKEQGSFIRARVLAARLALAQQETANARSELEAALTLNPKHQWAQALLDALP